MKKSFAVLCLSVLGSLFFALPVGASYIDPSVVSYAVSAIAGVLIAGSAVFVVLWKKLKHGVAKTLGIDENAGKEVEEEITLTEQAPTAEPTSFAETTADATPPTEE